MLRTKEIPKKPNKEMAKKTAYDFIIKNIENINFPVEPESFFTGNLHILPWSEANEVLGCCDCFNLKGKKAEARTKKRRDLNGYLTVYDDTFPCEDRIRFTKAHELGHIVLGHLDKYEKTSINRGGLTKKEYTILENEADFFASQLLSPVPLIQLLGLSEYENIGDLQKIFQISREAAKNRYFDILWHGNCGLYKEYIPKFQALFCNRIKLYKNGYMCNKCNHVSTNSINKTTYCPICGGSEFKKIQNISGGEFDHMKYKGIEIDLNSKALVCPKCNNEEILDGDFCKICSAYLINTCAGTSEKSCGNLCDGNARYCHKCGHKTTYFQIGWLEAWNKICDCTKPSTEFLKTVVTTEDDNLLFDFPF